MTKTAVKVTSSSKGRGTTPSSKPTATSRTGKTAKAIGKATSTSKAIGKAASTAKAIGKATSTSKHALSAKKLQTSKTSKTSKDTPTPTKVGKYKGIVLKKKGTSYVFEDGRVFMPKAEHKYTLIYLHHQTGRAWDFVDRWKWFDRMTGVRVVLPEAPKKYSAWYEGETTFWYDYVPNPDNNPKEVPLVDTMQECRDRILRVVQDEVALVGSAERVFLGGESQGAAAAFHCALDPRMPRIGGIVATSGTAEEETEAHPSKANLPIRFYIAGKDDIYPPEATVAALDRFKAAGFTDVKHKIHPKACHASDWANGWINEFIREMQAKDNYNPAKALERTKPLGDDETSLIIDKETKKWVAISQPAPESS